MLPGAGEDVQPHRVCAVCLYEQFKSLSISRTPFWCLMAHWTVAMSWMGSSRVANPINSILGLLDPMFSIKGSESTPKGKNEVQA